MKYLILVLFLIIFSAPAIGAENTENKSDAQLLFEKSLEMLKPLSDEQIKSFREFSKQQEEALSPVIPTLQTRTIRVSLEPGKKSPVIYTTPNTVTAIIFHDNTGSPWKVTSLTNGSPSSFQVLKPEIAEGNLVNILPLKSNSSTNIVLTLEQKDIPLVLGVQSDNIKANSRLADSMVLVQLAHAGPNALTPSIERISETVSSAMLAFLDQVPPNNALRVQTSLQVENLKVWKYEDKIFIRTKDLLLFPSWSASVNGAGNIKCYEIYHNNTRILLSIDGQIQAIDLEL